MLSVDKVARSKAVKSQGGVDDGRITVLLGKVRCYGYVNGGRSGRVVDYV